jgi:hypothetical protein
MIGLDGLGLACLVGQLGAVDPAVGVGAVEEAEEASRRRLPEGGVVEQGDGGLARVVVEESERVVAGAEAVTRRRRALAGGRVAGEDPGGRGRERHGGEPGVPEPQMRRASALPVPAAERGAQGGEVGNPSAARRLGALPRGAPR